MLMNLLEKICLKVKILKTSMHLLGEQTTLPYRPRSLMVDSNKGGELRCQLVL